MVRLIKCYFLSPPFFCCQNLYGNSPSDFGIYRLYKSNKVLISIKRPTKEREVCLITGWTNQFSSYRWPNGRQRQFVNAGYEKWQHIRSEWKRPKGQRSSPFLFFMVPIIYMAIIRDIKFFFGGGVVKRPVVCVMTQFQITLYIW